MQAFVPKNRRPKFDLRLRILDLNNVPYVSGRSYVKWHIPHSGAEGHKGRTEKVLIKDHKVFYNYDVHVPVRMVIDKNGMLNDLVIQFDVLHEVSSGGKGDRIHLGQIRINLAEYIEASEHQGEDGEGVTRRYLMVQSKINSTLKIGIFMRQTEGDKQFQTPPLRMAPVFSGIAGIVVGEPEDTAGLGSEPVLSQSAQVAEDELKELYKKTIAAYWTNLPGELSADKCIEHIFAGGNGWGHKDGDSSKSSGKDGADMSDEDIRNPYHRRKTSRWSSSRSSNGIYRSRADMKRQSKTSLSERPSMDDMRHQGHNHSRHVGIKGRASFEQQESAMGEDAEVGHQRQVNEIDEFDVKENFKSWKIPNNSATMT